MAFIRPTLETIINRVKGDLRSELGITTILRRTFIFALGKALAGVAHMLHGHLYWISRQIFPDQAELEYLERWASIYGLERKVPTYGAYAITVTGVNGSVLPAGTLWQREDGLQYSVDAEVTIAAGTATAIINAADPGADYNIDDGETVTLVSPVAGIDSEATIASTSVEAEDEEDDASFRERLVARIQQPPSGGTANDYIQWAREVAGVTRAWVFPSFYGSGTVGISFVEDDELDIIPDPAKVEEVQAYIEERKPVTSDVTTFAPVKQTLNMTISLRPNTSLVRAAVQAELEDLIARESQVGGSYKAVGEIYDGVISLSKMNEAISLAQNEEDHVITSPVADFDPGTGGIAVLGTITWQTLT